MPFSRKVKIAMILKNIIMEMMNKLACLIDTIAIN